MKMTFGRLAAVLLGIGVLSACQTSTERVTHREDSLTVAGFDARPANTPNREAMLSRLPAHKFVQHTNKANTIEYVYADPTVCKCLYIGSQAAYAKYVENARADRRIKQLKQALADHDNAVVADDEFNAQVYEDAQWDWGAWGPGYGYGGLGWQP